MSSMFVSLGAQHVCIYHMNHMYILYIYIHINVDIFYNNVNVSIAIGCMYIYIYTCMLICFSIRQISVKYHQFEVQSNCHFFVSPNRSRYHGHRETSCPCVSLERQPHQASSKWDVICLDSKQALTGVPEPKNTHHDLRCWLAQRGC